MSTPIGRGRGALVALLLLLVLPATAAAGPRFRVASAPYGPDDGDAFQSENLSFAVAGDSVVVHLRRHGRQLLVRRGPGRKPKALLDTRGRRGLPAKRYALAASDRRLAYISFEDTGPTEEGPPRRLHDEVRTQPLSGGPSVRLDVNSADRCTTPAEVAVAGDAVAWIDQSCHGNRPSTVRVRDLASPGAPTRTPATGVYAGGLVGAGRYLAWLQAPKFPGTFPAAMTVVVYDLAAGAVAFTVPADPGRTTSHVTVQGDGRIVVDSARATGDVSDRYDWYSPTAPTAHPIALGSLIQSPQLGADTLLVERSRDTGLAVADLAGHRRTFAPGPLGAFDAAFDGAHAAYSTQQCATQVLWLQDAAAKAPAKRSLACPARVGKAHDRGHGRASVRVRCPRGCEGTARFIGLDTHAGPPTEFRSARGPVTVTVHLRHPPPRAALPALYPIDVTTFDRGGGAHRRERPVLLRR